jgi:class 3 adenylate cyclase
MIALCSIAIAVSSWLAYRNAKASLRDAELRGLAGIRRTRASEIERYFRVIRNHADSLSDDRMFIEGVQKFTAACRKLEGIRYAELPHERVKRYYEEIYLPQVQKYMPLTKKVPDYLPTDAAAFVVQDHYVAQPALNANTGVHEQSAAELNEYVRVHSTYDRPIRKLAHQFGYDDLLLVEPQNLRIVYSVSKKPDFGTSLKVGPYRDTPLARIVKDAATTPNPDTVFVSDFARYEPSRGAPAAFVATPIVDGAKRIGVFVLQLSTAAIDRVVSGGHGWQKDGLGETGDLQIVGADHLMRSTSREFLEHPQRVLGMMQQRGVPQKEISQMQAYGTTILLKKVSHAAVDRALGGEEGTTVELSAYERPTFISFMPLGLAGLNWTLLSRIDVGEVLTPVYEFEHTAMLWSVIAILFTVAVALITTDRLLKPIFALVTAADRMSAGDLAARVHVHSKDELGVLSSTFNKMAESIRRNMAIIEDKNRENENLLLNILPSPIAERLKSGETVIADNHSAVTVLFADIVGFTKLSASREPSEVVALLNGLFTQFDASAKKHGIEKIKTIGDAYMAVSGLPVPNPDHTKQMMEMALDMLAAVKSYAVQLQLPIAIRIGINSGPVAAGVVGTTKFIYDLWGDTVNMASRMESSGMPGAIQVTRIVWERLSSEYPFEERGAIEIKGKGLCETWLLRPCETGEISEALAGSTRE